MPQLAPTKKQQEFLDRAQAGENIFLTGKAGTGKSFVIKLIIDILHSLKKHVIAIAPTGVAANNIDGQTIHSMFKLVPHGVLSFETCNYLKGASREVLKMAQVIIVDEVSMLRPDILDAMHLTLKKNGLPGLDERQIIFVGDLKQLPPVLDDNTRSVLYQTYDGDTFEYSKIYGRINVKKIELDEIMRQTDADFITNLNLLRDGKKSEYFRQFISEQPKGIVLAPHNSTVQKYNEAGLNSQSGKLFTFDASIDGTAKPEDFNFENHITVKNGCKIMYLMNSENNPLRNGTLGIFVSHKGCHYIRVGETDFALNLMEVTKKQYVYNSHKDKLELKTIGSIVQYPFKLAYALSIHKAQGLTFDEVTIDLSRPCFAKGQLYVGFSRVKSPEGLRIIL